MGRNPGELIELVSDVLVDVAGVPRESIALDKSLVGDFGIDSLATVEVIVELEQQTGVTISDDDAEKLTTVGGIVDYLTKKGV